MPHPALAGAGLKTDQESLVRVGLLALYGGLPLLRRPACPMRALPRRFRSLSSPSKLLGQQGRIKGGQAVGRRSEPDYPRDLHPQGESTYAPLMPANACQCRSGSQGEAVRLKVLGT